MSAVLKLHTSAHARIRGVLQHRDLEAAKKVSGKSLVRLSDTLKMMNNVRPQPLKVSRLALSRVLHAASALPPPSTAGRSCCGLSA